MKAVGEAIGFLTSDEARDIFAKAFAKDDAVSFVQMKSRSHISPIKSDRVRNILALASVSDMVKTSSKAQLDAFVKVKEALNKLKVELQEEQKDEFKTRDLC